MTKQMQSCLTDRHRSAFSGAVKQFLPLKEEGRGNVR